ncbi:hypothetical protein [Halobacillus massiliensis]|uniref:hypothetical protein n=1 Tax=Halobacillus massiliensis TaxID=1926286 RepID=UPI0009E2B868|nr:hypothetical protein [Halobacillus massiliensis]
MRGFLDAIIVFAFWYVAIAIFIGYKSVGHALIFAMILIVFAYFTRDKERPKKLMYIQLVIVIPVLIFSIAFFTSIEISKESVVKFTIGILLCSIFFGALKIRKVRQTKRLSK